MKSASLQLLSLSVAGFLGCATEEIAQDPCQPGDIDCAQPGGETDGKADAWDSVNDPRQLSNSLNYRLAELPMAGKLDQPVWKNRFPNAPSDMNPIWTETYFPSAEGSTNNRWLGDNVPSPLEKYDQAFNGVAAPAKQPLARCGEGAKAEWDAYLAEAGPAAKWHSSNFHSMQNGYNGKDDDGNSEIDECFGGKDGFGPDHTPAGWWGLCHAWTPASILEPEAIHPVTIDGVTFERSDIHALVMTVYDANNALMLGGRCNSESFNPDNTTSANHECADSNAGAMHVVLANFLGLNDAAIAMDQTAGTEIWNQPIYSYEVLSQTEVSASEAMQCVGSTGDTYTFNRDAANLYRVNTRINFIVEGGPSARVLPMSEYLTSNDYEYILEIGQGGKVIGGRYCQGTQGPDFLWAPQGPSTSSFARRNPNVNLDKVRMLISMSVEGTGNGGENDKTVTDNANVVIPDEAPLGISRELVVEGSTGSTISVGVTIHHTYREDLVVRLYKDGTLVQTLADRIGGSADDLVENFRVDLTGSADGVYKLEVVDIAAQDVGTLVDWHITYSSNQ